MTTIDNSEAYMIRYYEAFLKFLNSVGYYQAIIKLRDNADGGVYPVQVVAARYGYTEAAIDQEVIERNSRQWTDLKALNYWSQKVGYLPMNQEGMEKFLKFCEDKKRREYLRRKIKNLSNEGKLMPINELMIARYKLEKKRRDKEGLA